MSSSRQRALAPAGRTAGVEDKDSWGGKNGGRFWALALILLALNAAGLVWIGREVRAGGPDSVRVAQVLPVRGVDQASELALVFDRPIAPSDVIGITLAEPPFRTEPPLEGLWSWSEAARLELKLAKPLAPGRVYRLLAEPDFAALTGYRLSGEAAFELRTAALELSSLRVSSTSPDALQLAFLFNQPVRPEDLQAALEVSRSSNDSSREAPHVRVLTLGPKRELLVEVPRDESAERWLTVELAAGLCGAGGELGLSQALQRRLEVPVGFVALNAHAWASGSANSAQVYLSFSESLAPGQERPTLRITPPVEPVSTRVSGSRLTLEGDFRSGETYRIEVGASLLSARGSTLGESAELSVQIPKRSNHLSLSDGGGQLSPLGRLEVALRATNVQNLEVATARLHANNLVARLHGGSSKETSRVLPKQTLSLDLEPDRVTDCVLGLADLVDSPLGVYEVHVRDRDDRWESDRALVRVSDLTLTVKQESEGLFAWVTSLSSGAPLEGVSLEARSYNDQVLARATTDSVGRAHLAIPRDLPDGGAWVLTATLGEDFSYLLPERGTWVFDKVDTSGRAYEPLLDAWIYTDRGVYRPGETIHLAGLLRGVDGSFPVAALREVQLIQPDGCRRLIQNSHTYLFPVH